MSPDPGEFLSKSPMQSRYQAVSTNATRLLVPSLRLQERPSYRMTGRQAVDGREAGKGSGGF